MRMKALRAAFPYTVPIFAGFWFLGLAYGVMMGVNGFSVWYPLVMSVAIFSGSMEFVTAGMLLGRFMPLQSFVLALMINARHLFYGISMLERFRGIGRKRYYLIYGMCDETFSVNYTAHVPEGVDQGWFMSWVTLLNQAYWVSGAVLGGLFGPMIKFDTRGIDFCMTAMFVVIFMEQWMKDKSHFSAIAGGAVCVVCLLVFGPDGFIVPSMIGILLVLTFFRHFLERREA